MFIIKLEKYGTWFLVNFGICMLPFLFMILIGNSKEIIFSSFLSYNFTFLISSFYLLMQFIEVNKAGRRFPQFLCFLTIFWILIVMGFFVMQQYFTSGIFSAFFERLQSIQIAAYILLVTLTLSFLLNYRLIERDCKQLFSKRLLEKAKDVSRQTRGLKEQL